MTPAPQRRGRSIAMSPAEVDEFLAGERTCRVGTVGANGPHVTPLWFVWDGGALWLHTIVGSQRWADVERDPRVAVTADAGHDYLELRGVELRGTVEVVGEVPRTGEPLDELVPVETAFARKYAGVDRFGYDGRHAWWRLRPTAVTSWDFRKLAARGQATGTGSS